MSEKKNLKTVSISQKESLMVERSFYICNSYERFLAVLAREFANNPTDKTSKMIEHYRVLYQNEFIKLKALQDTIITSIVGKLYPDMHYEFDFYRQEVTIEW